MATLSDSHFLSISSSTKHQIAPVFAHLKLCFLIRSSALFVQSLPLQRRLVLLAKQTIFRRPLLPFGAMKIISEFMLARQFQSSVFHL